MCKSTMGNQLRMRYSDKVWYWIVKRLPHKIIYYCCLRMLVHATTNEYSNTEVMKLTAIEAIKRYVKDNAIHLVSDFP